MAGCPNCGSEILWVEDESGNRFAVNPRADVLTGERFMLDQQQPPVAKPMSESYIGYGYQPHDATCSTRRERERV